MKRIVITLAMVMTLVMGMAQVIDPAHWTFSSRVTDGTEVELTLTVQLDPGWHIYSQHTDPNGPIPLEVTFEKSGQYTLKGGVVEPKPHQAMDSVFGVVVKSFDGKVTFRQVIERKTQEAFVVKGSLYYQLCNEGSCIAPDDKSFTIAVAADKRADIAETAVVEEAAEQAMAADSGSGSQNAQAERVTVSDKQADTDEAEPSSKGGLWGIFFAALGFGIVTMFTPCVFPMIPMTVNFFMHGSDNRRRNRRQAWFFGFSIVFIFTVLGGLLSLLLGPDALNLIGTHGITNLIFFAIFMLFALSFFGLFEITMPERWVNKSDEQANKGGWIAPFFIALTTVLISFSCTGPIIGGALVGFATSTANRWVSLLTMLGFGIGFALPFTLLAFFPSALKKMKSGSWLQSVKIVFAFLELAFGLKFLQMADLYWSWHLIDREVYLALWIVIFGLMGMYLLGKLRFKDEEAVTHIGIVRLMLSIATFSFVVYMIPGLWGAPLNGISGFLPPMDTQDFNIEKIVVEHGGTGNGTVQMHLPADRKYADRLHLPTGFEGFYDIEEAKAYAQKVGKPVFIDFTGRNCANCREMEQVAWVDPRVKALLQNDFIICALYADMNDITLPEEEWITDGGRTIKTLGRRNLNYQIKAFNQNAQPCYAVVDGEGEQVIPEVYIYDPSKSGRSKAEGMADFLQKARDAYRASR